MSGRAGRAVLADFAGDTPGVATVPPGVSAQAACAQRVPDFAISSPGETPEAQTPQVVAYLAVIGTHSP
jgi:hypothetical protein